MLNRISVYASPNQKRACAPHRQRRAVRNDFERLMLVGDQRQIRGGDVQQGGHIHLKVAQDKGEIAGFLRRQGRSNGDQCRSARSKSCPLRRNSAAAGSCKQAL